MVKWTEQEYAEYISRGVLPAKPVDVSNPPFKLPPNEAGHYALGRLPIGTMNKTEAAYDRLLWVHRNEGAVIWHKFEAVKLRLADNTFYTPDFMVLTADRLVEMHEVKGFWQDDARVKIKVAASIYPFKFVAVTRVKQGWQREEF